MKKGVITLLSALLIFGTFSFFALQNNVRDNAIQSIVTSIDITPEIAVKNNDGLIVKSNVSITRPDNRISKTKLAPASKDYGCETFNDSNECNQFTFDTNLSTDSTANDYCLQKNKQGQCTTFTLNTNFKEYFYDEKLHATKAMPMLALLSSSNFHEVMLNMDSIATNTQIFDIKVNLNQALERIKEQGLAINAQQVECGDYLCAVDFGEISEEASDLATKLLHDSDSRLDSVFTNTQRIIFSLDDDIIYHTTNAKKL